MANVPWYLDPTLLPAAFGLLGVIVGGLITAVSAFFLEQRREQREREKEQAIRDIELRTAARLVELDFRVACAIARVSLQNSSWSDEPPEPLTCQAWDTYRATLASELPFDEWLELVLCTMTVSQVNSRREQARRVNSLAIDAKTAKYLERAIKRFQKGQAILLRLARPGTTAELSPDSGEPDTQSDTAK